MSDPTAQMTDLEQVKRFMLAGDATFTLSSKLTGKRYTFKVEKAPDKPGTINAARTGHGLPPLYFVRVLTGPENTSDYRYLGCFQVVGGFLRNLKLNKQQWGADILRAFGWLLTVLDQPLLFRERFLEQSEFWHAGRCGKCGRTLTTPESVARGLGPTCANC